MIDASGTFRLSAYLRDLSVTLTLRSGESVPFTDVALSENCLYQFGVMVHDLWAGGVIPMEVIRDDVAQLRVDYHINFTGHPYEEPDFFETTIPLLARGSAADQFGRNWRST